MRPELSLEFATLRGFKTRTALSPSGCRWTPQPPRWRFELTKAGVDALHFYADDNAREIGRYLSQATARPDTRDT